MLQNRITRCALCTVEHYWSTRSVIKYLLVAFLCFNKQAVFMRDCHGAINIYQNINLFTLATVDDISMNLFPPKYFASLVLHLKYTSFYLHSGSLICGISPCKLNLSYISVNSCKLNAFHTNLMILI